MAGVRRGKCDKIHLALTQHTYDQIHLDKCSEKEKGRIFLSDVDFYWCACLHL